VKDFRYASIFSSIICPSRDLLFARIYVGIFSVKIGLVVNLGLVVELVFSWWFKNWFRVRDITPHSQQLCSKSVQTRQLYKLQNFAPS
jgi:hypothetical protein